MRPAYLVLALFLVTGCTGVSRNSKSPIDCSPAPTVGRAETLRIAESYRSHQWRPTDSNIFHGKDSNGIQIDTPDVSFKPKDRRPGWWVPNRTNTGVPYQWGGFDTPAEFDAKLAAGKAAGDIYSDLKRAQDNDAVSDFACGIDCSGFISRCLRLERPYSTRKLPDLCDQLRSFEDLQPGDIVNLENTHSLLFVKWLGNEKRFFDAYETGSPPSWKVLRHPIEVNYVKGLGFKPYRYKNIRDS